ncbi:MAG: type II toxin-antitoxin system HigB family toxin [Bryobacteraceae bacterium]|jgi:mRNA interferase HigB
MGKAIVGFPGALKADFGSADFVGDLTVFNVGGNKYRLIAFVHYRRQIVYIKHILTHEKYDEGNGSYEYHN